MATETDSLIPMDRLEKAAAVMRVLSHPHRLRICELLMADRGDRFSVKQLAEHLQIPSNAVSQHLGIMKAHGLLVSERKGKTVYYQVVDSRPKWLLDCLRGNVSESSDELDTSVLPPTQRKNSEVEP